MKALLITLALSLSIAGLAADSSLDTAFRIAVLYGRIRDVDRLIQQGANVNSQGAYGETALMYAARYGRVQLIERLLEAGADPNLRDHRDETALIKASRECSHLSLVRLLRSGAHVNDINHEGKAALHYAAADACKNSVAVLIAQPNVKLDLRDYSGKSPLDHAAAEAVIEVNGPFTDVTAIIKAAQSAREAAKERELKKKAPFKLKSGELF